MTDHLTGELSGRAVAAPGVAGRAESPSARIVAEIRHRITSGELADGDRVPSTRQITREFGVAMATASKVLTALRTQGLVRAVPGVGTVVAAGPDSTSGAGPSDGSGAGPSDGSGAGPSDESGAGPSDESGAGPSDESGAGPSNTRGRFGESQGPRSAANPGSSNDKHSRRPAEGRASERTSEPAGLGAANEPIRASDGALRAGQHEIKAPKAVDQIRGIGDSTAPNEPARINLNQVDEHSGRNTRRSTAQNGRSQARDREPALSRALVLNAAISIADAEGLGALSMRRVAAELGTATMSLYRHVKSKDELLMLMAEQLFARHPLPPAEHDWRVELQTLCRMQWRYYQLHPWLAQYVSMTRPQLIPSAMAHTERAMSVLDSLGLDVEQQLHGAVTLANYVRGTAVNLEPEAQAEQDTGITSEEWMESQNAVMAEIISSGEFPMFSKINERDGVELSLDTLFEFGLSTLLDGLAVLAGESVLTD